MGSIVLTVEDVRDRIARALPGSHVEVNDLTGTSNHFEAIVVAPQFEGRSRIEQHKLVYGALGGAMGNEIHALALKTFTPGAPDAPAPGLNEASRPR